MRQQNSNSYKEKKKQEKETRQQLRMKKQASGGQEKDNENEAQLPRIMMTKAGKSGAKNMETSAYIGETKGSSLVNQREKQKSVFLAAL